ncbi:GNAT family N-acetyltransferase [Streptomyces sp. DT73]|uniref:GNAT family N-acetyltransferase n=1 Tax=Streptomyces sp. DT73 TaxID=3393420 RepID=UPI003CF8702C
MAKRKKKPAQQPFRVQVARLQDEEAMMRNLALADPDNPAPFESSRTVLIHGPQGPLSHGRALLLVARHRDGHIVGALTASPSDWIRQHPGLTQLSHQDAVANRLVTVAGVGVDPAYRRQGVAHALITEAERYLARQGVGLLTLDHKPDLTGFYDRLGFAHGEQLVIHLPPPLPLIFQPANVGMIHAFKPLENNVHLRTVPGYHEPMVSGLVSRLHIPAQAVFLPGRGLSVS